jgi:hypothetical protein
MPGRDPGHVDLRAEGSSGADGIPAVRRRSPDRITLIACNHFVGRLLPCHSKSDNESSFGGQGPREIVDRGLPWRTSSDVGRQTCGEKGSAIWRPLLIFCESFVRIHTNLLNNFSGDPSYRFVGGGRAMANLLRWRLSCRVSAVSVRFDFDMSAKGAHLMRPGKPSSAA